MAKSKRGHGRKWTAKEVALLKELYPECPIGEIAKRLGRTTSTVKNRAYRLGLKRKSSLGKLWTAEEVQLLIELYSTHEDIQDIAERIGRTPNAVRAKAHYLGFGKSHITYDL
jgi:DNA-binding MarR family transcriptional regulator